MNKIDHDQAIQSRAAERYLLGELSEKERDAYEEHFFSCAACAEEVKQASDFVQSAGQFFRADAAVPAAQMKTVPAAFSFSRLFQPLPAMGFAAALVLVALGIYQNVVTIPALKQAAAPQTVAVVSLLSQSSRAEGVAELKVSRHQALGLNIAVPPGFNSYACRILGSSGFTQSCGLISAQQAKDIVQVLVPPGALAEGKYSVVIYGIGTSSGEEQELARYSFILQFQD
ncbi:MAG TPA: anti-sigma factor [Alphaproteobacteria bacterium]|nr:anti-sigma factor [Alphaproteobacteria bacterium]